MPSDAATVLHRGQLTPDLIVAAQAFPGQISHAAIAQLRRLAPLARIVGLLGSWCEGEMRTGSPWPGAVRVYWHQWTPRADRQLRRMVGGRPCAWSLPPTATEEERLLADADPMTTPIRPTDSRGLVLIRSNLPEMAEWLSAMCRRQGFATVRQCDSVSMSAEGVRAAIFDADRFDTQSCAKLKRLTAALRPSPVLALTTFPREEDRRKALEAGAAAVLSKPFLLDDLLELELSSL
ncbi:MAG: hypothetical protein LLF97_03300 [Planctomycetaceae bacterium]|nr:hypothetical protein [Planctomycetaceae bacterium]